ncbi:MAG: HNH endonuclease signature motif containing protein [FCB group bacterium]|jgi:5-methylcytosine-specific restriction endonuclease McrA|nr:HNH endonuclease signature motif containing protein [FCB group bacterium]
MAFDQQRQDAIFKKTDGRCHICRKKLARKNYGGVGARGAWEVEHSVPQAVGGTHHLNNLYPACIPCNRSKRDSSTKKARGKHGHRAAPLSKEKKTGNAWLGGFGGAIAGRILFASLGPLGIAAGAVVGAVIGNDYEPD